MEKLRARTLATEYVTEHRSNFDASITDAQILEVIEKVAEALELLDETELQAA